MMESNHCLHRTVNGKGLEDLCTEHGAYLITYHSMPFSHIPEVFDTEHCISFFIFSFSHSRGKFIAAQFIKSSEQISKCRAYVYPCFGYSLYNKNSTIKNPAMKLLFNPCHLCRVQRLINHDIILYW